MTTATLPSSRLQTSAVWVLRILMAALFLFAASMKLTSQPMMVGEFELVGLGQWFRFFTGTLELIGAVALVIPRVSVFGAILLLLVDIGACVAQITAIHMDFIHTIIIGAILAVIIYLQRDRLTLSRAGS